MTGFRPDASHAEEEEPGRECDGWSVGPAETIRGRPDRPTIGEGGKGGNDCDWGGTLRAGDTLGN